MEKFLDSLKIVSDNPLAYVAFLMVLAGWLWRAYSLRTQHFVRSMGSLPSKDKLSALQILALGYPQELTDAHLRLMRNRSLLFAYISTLLALIIIAGLVFYNLSSGAASKAQAEQLLNEMHAQTKLLENLKNNFEQNAHGEQAVPQNIISAYNQLKIQLAEVNERVGQYEARYGPLPAAQTTISQATSVVRQVTFLIKHTAIPASLANMSLSLTTRTKLNELLEGKSIDSPDIYGWAYSQRISRPQLSKLLFVDIEVEDKAYDPEKHCPRGECVIGALEKYISILSNSNASRADRREALLFIVPLVADLHIPLHCADRHDAGGNKVKVTVRGRSMNLHSLWDNFLVDRAMGEFASTGDFTQALIRNISAADLAQWSQGTVADWGWETHNLAISQAYKGIPETGPVTISEQYLAEGAQVMKSQVTKAGVRLAVVLNKALDH